MLYSPNGQTLTRDNKDISRSEECSPMYVYTRQNL